MEPVRERPSGPRARPEGWRRPGIAFLLVAAVVVAVVVVRARTTPPQDIVKATHSYDTIQDTRDTSPSVPSGLPPGTGEPATTPPLTSGIPDVSQTPATISPTVDDPEAALADPNFFVAWLPELRTMAAPAWVTRGTRLSYYASAASVPGSYHQYVEDENGGWIDPDTGDRYRQEDVSSASGHGFNQVSVTALNDAVAVLSVRVYGLTDLSLDSPVTTLAWGGAVGLPGAGSDYWLHPDVLAGVDEIVSPTLKVVRMPYVIDETEYSSIWIQSISDDGNYTWVYDEDTGVLLHTASSTTGPPLGGPVAAGEGRDGSTFLTQSTLVGIRQTTLPWATGAAPPWVASTDHLEYVGTISVSVAGSPSVVLDCSLAVDRRASGTDWVRYLFARTITSDVAPSVTEYTERIDGPAQVGALWVPPDELARLSAGQELDRDPVTRAVVTVSSVDDSEWGPAVTILETGPAEEFELVYDVESGLLVSSVSLDLHFGLRIEYQFSNWS